MIITIFMGMPSVFIETFGCQMNVADSNMLADLLAQRGYIQVDTAENADLIIVNTCSVRQRAEIRSQTRIEEYCRQKKSFQNVWVIGCMAQRLGDYLKSKIPGISHIIGSRSIEHIAHDIDHLLSDHAHVDTHSHVQKNEISSFIPVMRGCNNYCAYCIVPYVRGPEHSISANAIFEHAQKLVINGTKELTLLGQNVNSYHDDKKDFADLLKLLHSIEGLERIRFVTSHPKDISDKLIYSIASLPKVCKHIHLPVQSGSDKILHLMNRKYTVDHYCKVIDTLRTVMPNTDITTDVIVGFPGETESDFQETMSLFSQLQFTAAFMFVYSEREGTKAACLPHQIPSEIKKNRLQKLIELQTVITKKHYDMMVGEKVQVLITSKQNRRDFAWMGQDSGSKRVLVRSDEDIAGKLLTVKITQSSGMTLIADRTDV